MAVPKIIKLIGAHMNVSFPELSVVDMGSFLYLHALLDQLDQLVVLGASHVDCSLAVLMEHTYKSVSGIGVAATFKRVRYFMETLSKAYAECNGVGGLSTSAGGSVRYGGPGANPNGMAPKVCCGGSGAKGPCAHGKKDFAFLAASHGCSGGDDGPSSGFNFNLNPKGLQQRGGGDGLGGGHASRLGEGINSRCFVAADGGDDEVAIAGKTATSTMQADAFLQSAYNVSEDEQMRFELRELKNIVEANPLSFHTRKIQAFGVCATSSPDLMNILTSANIVMSKGKPDSLPEFCCLSCVQSCAFKGKCWLQWKLFYAIYSTTTPWSSRWQNA